MSLDYPICVENVGISILSDTSPAAVEYEGRLWVFYNGSGDDGIWYTRFDGTGWEHARCTHGSGSMSKELLLPRNGTSPCPVVHGGRLYLFWSNRTKDGILYSVWNGKRFSGIVHDIGYISGRDISLGQHTSPAAISYDGKLYVFWTGTGREPRLYYTTTTPSSPGTDYVGDEWQKAACCVDHVESVGVAPGTSPALTVFKGKLHVFYNGAGEDGTWYFTHSGGSAWSAVISIQQTVGGNGFLCKTSPVALTMTGRGKPDRLGLLWTGDGGNGVWYSVYNEGRWFQQQSVLKAISNHALHSNSNCSAIEFLNEPYIFWAGLEGGLWFTTRRIYDVIRDEREMFSVLLGASFDEILLSLPLIDPDLCALAHKHLETSSRPLLNAQDHGSSHPHPDYREFTIPAQSNPLLLTSFLTSMIDVVLSKDLIAPGIYIFASFIHLAISRGYAIKVELIALNDSLKAEVIGPGKEKGPSVFVPQKKVGSL